MKKTMRRLIVACALLLPILSEAKHLSYQEVHRMPKSIEKDYYIWRYLRQKSTTPSQARAIIRDVSMLNGKLKRAYKRKTGRYPRFKPTPPKYYYRIKHKWENRIQGNYAFNKGLAMVRRGQLKRAAGYFAASIPVFEEREQKDKALFWLYLVTKDGKYLKKLQNSYHVNFYTLLAADLTKSNYPDTIVVPKADLPSLGNIDANSPIVWAKIKQSIYTPTTDLDALAEECKSKATIGIHSYIKEYACHQRKSYFPMPYRDAMKRYSVEKQALIYAIARQESRFVPGAVSRSFALGMMQLMPFLIDHIAKEKHERIDYDDIFNPYKAIEYAAIHIDYLNRYLYHPLFIAYAYNGGIGFTKRLIRRKGFFKKGRFEPYLSIESIPSLETREYGKKVLTNYIVYLNLLGKPTRLLPFVKTLTDPDMTDRFRK